MPVCADDYTPSPAIGSRSDVEFFSSLGPTTVAIRRPNWNNTEQRKLDIIVHNNSSGIIRVDQKAYWIPPTILSLTFSELCQDEKDDLEAFLILTAGTFITYTDHEDRDWVCVVLTKEPIFVTHSRGPKYSITLQLQGLVQP
jgi:hypothetical protein